MAEWLYEAGIGENRAALVIGGRIAEARIEREDDRLAAPGAVVAARYLGPVIATRSGLVRLDHGVEALLEPLPPRLAEGAALTVEITRAAIPEPGKPKRARARISDALPRPAPALRDELAMGGHPVVDLALHGDDRLEHVGWSELLEEALTGRVAFPGGMLTVSLTPAMAVIDVDGRDAPVPLALAAAAAVGDMVRRHNLAGSIVIDFPSLPGRADRQAVGEALDAALADVPFERTAMNGFGLVQIVRRRMRASLPELVQADPALTAALALIRRASRGHGPATLAAHPAVIAAIAPAWLDALARLRGGGVGLRPDPALGIAAGHVEPALR